jgi:hypothetical protein
MHKINNKLLLGETGKDGTGKKNEHKLKGKENRNTIKSRDKGNFIKTKKGARWRP